ncbi:MAG: hypothetical protein HQL81_02190 [Magnetococcales bacterium]|nr:hypothetical protein [Magnetococcales bacterium]
MEEYDRTRQNDLPLWPTLARLVARQLTDGDRQYLDETIRHPEHLPPPYAEAVRFWLRGDLLLLDDKEVTLNDLLGFELPYWEEMPDEWDIDWEKEEKPEGE